MSSPSDVTEKSVQPGQEEKQKSGGRGRKWKRNRKGNKGKQSNNAGDNGTKNAQPNDTKHVDNTDGNNKVKQGGKSKNDAAKGKTNGSQNSTNSSQQGGASEGVVQFLRKNKLDNVLNAFNKHSITARALANMSLDILMKMQIKVGPGVDALRYIETLQATLCKDVMSWQSGRVQGWVANDLGMGQYAKLFKDQDIDGSVLFDLKDTDLEKIGVNVHGHRMKILKGIKGLQQSIFDKISDNMLTKLPPITLGVFSAPSSGKKKNAGKRDRAGSKSGGKDKRDRSGSKGNGNNAPKTASNGKKEAKSKTKGEAKKGAASGPSNQPGADAVPVLPLVVVCDWSKM